VSHSSNSAECRRSYFNASEEKTKEEGSAVTEQKQYGEMSG
jgi:hypothetical protein